MGEEKKRVNRQHIFASPGNSGCGMFFDIIVSIIAYAHICSIQNKGLRSVISGVSLMAFLLILQHDIIRQKLIEVLI